MAPRSVKYNQSDKKAKKIHQKPVRKTIEKKTNTRSVQQMDNFGSTQNIILKQNIPEMKPIQKQLKAVGLVETKHNIKKIKMLSTTDQSRNDISSSSRTLRSASRQMNSQEKNTGNKNCISSKAKTSDGSILKSEVTSNNGTENLKLVEESKRKVEKKSKISKSTKLVRHLKFERNDVCFAKMTGHAPWPSQVSIKVFSIIFLVHMP